MKSRDSLEVSIPDFEDRPVLPHDRSDEEVEVADCQSAAVQLTPESGRLLCWGSIKWECFEATGQP